MPPTPTRVSAHACGTSSSKSSCTPPATGVATSTEKNTHRAHVHCPLALKAQPGQLPARGAQTAEVAAHVATPGPQLEFE